MKKIARSLGIHDGPFHADEVTASALLLLYNLVDRDKIIRTRDPAILVKCEFVCDVGGVYDPANKLFDHHQVEYTGFLSSAGMVLMYLKNAQIIEAEEWQFFQNALVFGVDEHDNGRAPQVVGYCSFSHVIANFVPISYTADEKELLEAFLQALDFAHGHIFRLRKRYFYNKECRNIVREKMIRYKTCLLFDKAIPWMESFFALRGKNHPALFVVMPAASHWKLRGIPPSYDQRMQVRISLPREWAGLLDDQLKKVSGIDGAIFCHKGRFTSVWKTRTDALKALDYVLKSNGLENHDNFI
ncbi:MAG: MYG1 family protein [Chlamydiia bacterium]|nr:MYG1 family protein [Chlamydiia bacterium]